MKLRNRLATSITRVLNQGCQKDATNEVNVLKAVVKQLKLQTTIRFAGDFKPRMSSETRENVWRFWEAKSGKSTVTARPAKLRVTDKPKCQKDLEYASTVASIVTFRNRQFYQSIRKVTSSQLLGLYQKYCEQHPNLPVSKGSFFNLKPFYIRNASKQHIEMCL